MSMTAQLVELFPTGEQADETVKRTVDALIKGKNLRRQDVARLANIPQSTFYRKLSARGSQYPFAAGEVASIARVLGVKVGQLYDGLGGTFVPPQPPNDGASAVGADGRGVTNRYLSAVAA